MSSTPASISNYFEIVKEDELRAKSLPPHLSGIILPGRAYGGVLVSQAVNSLIALYPHLIPHTINYKYAAPAKTNAPSHFTVNNADSNNIASVTASQNGETLGMGHIRYTHESEYLDTSHFECPTEYGSPEDYSNIEELAQAMEGKMKAMLESVNTLPMELRPVESALFPSTDVYRNSTWMRIKPEYHGDLKPNDGLAVALFLSDFTIMQTASEIYEKARIKVSSTASLHHSVRIHDSNLDPLGWYLFVGECDVISFGRARLQSNVFNEARKCVMTVVQEAYFQRAGKGTPKL